MGTLDNLRRDAKRWLKDLRDGQPSARARLKAAWPEAPDAPVLRDVQHALAREHGFANWTAFKEAIAARRTEPATGVTSADHVERFLGYACWDHHTHGASAYDGNRNAALRLLRKHPDLPRMSLYTAIACGELDTVRRLVEADPAVAATKGGPRGWDPILYLCYARLPLPSLHQNAVAIAQLLLDAGANPNAYYMAGASNYSALVGVAGEGEQDAPRDQPYKSALYQLLLERGAGPYDMQVLYNTHFSGDMQWWLELTYQHDVRRGDISAWQDPAWDMLGMGGYGPGSYFVLKVAVAKNDLRLAEWALTHGAHPNLMTSSHPKFAPRRTHYQEAVIRGHREMAELLARHGAAQRETTLEGEESFVAACLQLDRDRVRRMLADHPEYLRSPKAIFAAAELNRADVVELLLDLGVPIEVEDERKQRPLHVAAGNHALDVARLLIARGAGIDPRETQFNATPLGFAAYGNDRQMVDLLVPHTKSPWHLSWLGEVGRLREVLAADPALAGQRSAQDGTPLMRLPDDERKAVEVVDILLAHGADPSVQTKHEGKTAADYARERGLDDAARRLDAACGFHSPAEERVSPTIERLESLAKDLVVAHDTGEPGAIARLVAQFGGQLSWEQVRQGVRQQLRSIPQSELPPGYFALPQARLVVARYSGFQSWKELEEAIDFRYTPERVAQAFSPAVIEPGMIRPIEMKGGFRIRMQDGSHVTTAQVWDMLIASRNGDLERVQSLVAVSPALVVCDYNYMAPLHLAVREGHLGIVTFLADRGAANPKYVTYPYRESLVTVARDRGYEAIARLLEERYASGDPNRKEDEGGEILYERDEDRVRFQKLVNTDAMPEVEAMLEARPELALDPFAFWSEGILSMPANRGHRPMIELLLRYGAEVPQVTKWGAWYYFKRLGIAQLLMDRGMSPHHMNCHHTTLLHDMAYTGEVDKATLLLDHGADLDALDEEFRSTPLGLAARFGKREMVEFLLDRRADPNRAASPWATPLEWAKKKGHADIEHLLRGAGVRDSKTVPRSRPSQGDSHLSPAPDPIRVNPPRWMPVRPDLAEIEREVEREGGGDAVRQRIAREYGADSWQRLILCCRLVDAIWRNDITTVREIVTAHPKLLHEDALIRAGSNWGRPMTYTANLGHNRMIRMLHDLGATDLDTALDRAVLQGQTDTARMLFDMGARLLPGRQALEGPAETLNAQGMALMLELGIELTPETAPVDLVLETYSRNPLGKHQILELFVREGIALPDTPPMAVHRGRLDVLERHVRRDPTVLSRTFTHAEIYPPELGCHTDETLALGGTPVGGAGLLAMCIEYDEMEMAAWMIEHGADVNLQSNVDADGFGGYTPLFHTVVTQASRSHGEYARLLLAHGADPRVRASLRKALRGVDDESMHEYRDVTAVEWGERFHHRSLVNEHALRLIRARLEKTA